MFERDVRRILREPFSLAGGLMPFSENSSSSPARHADRDDSVRHVWFETRWGIAAFAVAACLAGSGSLYYVVNHFSLM